MKKFLMGVLTFLLEGWMILGISVLGQARDDAVTLGGLLILSGPISGYGSDNKAGMEIALEHINASGGVLGRPVKVELYDTAFDRAQTVALLRRLAANPSIPVVVGPTGTAELIAAAPVAQELGIAVISTGSAGPWPGKFNPYTFRVNITTINVLPGVLQEIVKRWNVRTAAILYDVSQDYTVSERQTAEQVFAELGVKVLGIEAFRAGDRQFGPQLSRVMRSGSPDLIYLGATTEEAALVIRQAKERGFTGLFLGAAGLNDPRIMALSSGAAVGALTFFPFNPDDARPVVQRFVADYRAKFGKAPPAYAALGYDATMLALDAIRRAGSLDREAVRAALGSTRMLELVNGFYTYEGSGDNKSARAYVFQMTADGSFRPVR